MANVNYLLASGRLIARRKAPYFAEVINSLVPTVFKGLGTIGVTKRLLLVYDPEWIALRNPDEMAALYWHETMHVILNHFDRRGEKDPFIYNVAGDLFINDQGRGAGFVFPKGGLFPEQFGLAPNLTTDEYYTELMKQAKEALKELVDRLNGDGWQSGECGSGAGNPFKGEPDEGDPANGARSEAEAGQLRIRTAEAIKQHVSAKGRGSVPSGLDRWADGALETPKVPWQTELAIATRHAIAYRPGAVDLSFSRSSRRQAALGYGPGVPMIPAYVRPVPRVCFVLDTSGSMGDDRIMAAIDESAGILESVGAEITFLSIDAAVHGVTQVRSVEELKQLVKGGGGTDFRPAFKAAMELVPRCEVLIYATDGDGPAPSEPPPFKTIWLLIDCYREPAEWGDKIHISARADAS